MAEAEYRVRFKGSIHETDGMDQNRAPSGLGLLGM
jgi:hypothetical protein